MSLFRLCVFSEVKGRVVLNGQPVANAVVERRYWLVGIDKETVDGTKTDANGYFRFGKLWYYTLLAWYPGEANVHQEIWITHAEQKYEAWRLTKHQPLEPDSELPNAGEGGDFGPNKRYDRSINYPKRKILLVCDLAQPAVWKEPRFGEEQLLGICTVVNML